MIELLNVSANERIDLADFTHAAQTSLLGALQALPEAALTAPTKRRMWVLRGFALSNPTGQVLQVDGGAALLALQQGLTCRYGIVSDGGPAQQQIDMSSRAAGTYQVYIRFTLAPGSFDTRTFYRAAGGGQEYAQSVPTRLSGTWEMAVKSVSPGVDWLKVGEVVAPAMQLTDTRPLYFEGDVSTGTPSGWGSSDDRNPDRAKYGIGDLQTALAALRQGLEDIKGPGIARWYSAFVAGQSIGYAGTAVAGRTSWLDANFYAQGDANRPGLVFGADNTSLRYDRTQASLAATGPAVAPAAGSTALNLALGQGSDGATWQGSSYRSTTATGLAALDGAWGRGAAGQCTGGLGSYGAQGLMAGAGVGLGYALGGQAPALFVGASNTVALGVSKAAQVVGDARALLQAQATSGLARGLGLTDGSTMRALWALHNAAPLPGDTASYTGSALLLGPTTPHVVMQGNQSFAALKFGMWAFGQGAAKSTISSASVNIIDAPTVVAGTGLLPGTNTPYNIYARTPVLALNSYQATADYQGSPMPPRVTFGYGGNTEFYLEGGDSAFSFADLINGVVVTRYSAISKVFVYAVPAQAPSFQATAVGGYQYNPAVTHVDTLPGIMGSVRRGTPNINVLVSFTAAIQDSVGSGDQNVVDIVMPLRAMRGQQLKDAAAVYQISNSGAAVNCRYTLLRYSNGVGTDTTIAVNQRSTGAGNGGVQTLASPSGINTDPSSDGVCWALRLEFGSASPFTAILRTVNVTFQTSSLQPQRQ